MKNFCKALREHMEEIINYEKRKYYYSQKKRKSYIVNRNVFIYTEKNLAIIMMMTAIYIKLEITVIPIENIQVMYTV